MIENKYVVQYAIGARKVDDQWIIDEDMWVDDTDFNEFTFDPSDPQERQAAKDAAVAVRAWMQRREDSAYDDDEDIWKIPFRVVHRISSDEVL